MKVLYAIEIRKIRGVPIPWHPNIDDTYKTKMAAKHFIKHVLSVHINVKMCKIVKYVKEPANDHR